MKNILTILIFLLFLTSPLSVQYTQNGFQFQREAQGKTTCDDDDEDCKEEDEEDEDEVADGFVSEHVFGDPLRRAA